jgi:hypothetical protein
MQGEEDDMCKVHPESGQGELKRFPKTYQLSSEDYLNPVFKCNFMYYSHGLQVFHVLYWDGMRYEPSQIMCYKRSAAELVCKALNREAKEDVVLLDLFV